MNVRPQKTDEPKLRRIREAEVDGWGSGLKLRFEEISRGGLMGNLDDCHYQFWSGLDDLPWRLIEV